jgi:outer membrane receptor for ferrienterochelin and colicin
MSNWKLLSGVAAASIMTAAIVAPAEAQVTTSSVRGQVVDANGAAVSGATVTITDTRTGSVDTATTNESGVYAARSLRVGGPYMISVTTADGSAVRENVFLQVNEAFRGDLQVVAERTMDTVTVVGTTGDGTLALGPRSSFGLETIESLPTISRDIRDIARLDPLVTVDETNGGAISIAGTNNRYNSLTIDGIKFNDLFGLNANGFPSQRSPISVDALETLSVEVAPYDVEFSGFTGGTVNVLTKSGQNDFFGSAYYFYSDDDFSGEQVNGREVDQSFRETTWGVTLGGPIIKDKLFFFASYEDFEAEQLLDAEDLPGASGVSQATYDTVRQITIDEYGFDPLAFGGIDPVTDKKFLANLDWIINNDHSAKLTYIQNEGNEIQPRNNGADLGSPSTWYDRSEETTAYAVQVFSDWSDNFSTEVKVAYSEQITGQQALAGSDVANFEISTPDGTISIGPDFFRHANELENELWQFKLKGEYVYGDHVFKAGYERDDQTTFNLFVPGSEGSYEFDSIADYQARTANTLFYQNAVTNDENDGAANFGFAVDSLYLQDVWQATDKLTVTAGVRYDRYSSDGEITENPNFEARYGFKNNSDVDGLDIIMPRIGLNYEYSDNVTLRGGFGRFSGGSPAVWISNNYSNNGVNIDSVFQAGFRGDDLTNIDARNVPTAAQSALTAGDGDVNVLDPNFEVPSLWRANIGADVYFDIGQMEGFKWSFDYIHGVNDKAAYWKDISCAEQAIGSSPDGRPVYNCGLDGNFLAGLSNQQIVDFYRDGEISNALVGSRASFDTDGDGNVGIDEVEVAPEALLLTNIDKGKQQIFTTRLGKDWGELGQLGSLYTSLSYTWQDSTDAHSGTSSTASSNYSDYAAADRQNPTTSVSNYQREHEFKIKLDWEKEFIENYPTKVTLFGSRRSGAPFSYTYDYGNGNRNDFADRAFNGIREGRGDDEGQLFYVPTGAGDPLFNEAASFGGDAQTLADFYAFLDQSGLNKFAGGIAPRNEFSSRWYTDVDLRIQQQLPGPLFENDRDRLIAFLDIENVGNLINDEWGYLEQVRYEYFQPVANVDVVNGQYVYSGFPERSERSVSNGASLWQVQLGIKYQF